MHGTPFFRPARNYPDRLPGEEYIITAPPVVQNTPTGGATWLQYLLPLVGSLGSVVFVIIYHSNPLLLLAAVVVALASVSIGFAVRFQQRQAIRQVQKADEERYTKYLATMREQLRKVARLQREVYSHLYPHSTKIISIVARREQVWERRREDEDFLNVRIGLGTVPLCCQVRLDLGSNPLVKHVDDLQTQAEALVSDYRYLDTAPVVISLSAPGILTLQGKRAHLRALARAMLCQVAAFHSPEDVRILASFPSESLQEWSWLKWLPHVRRLRLIKTEQPQAAEMLCLLADNVDDLRDMLTNQIKPELDRRRKLYADKREAASLLMKPHLIILIDGFVQGSTLAQIPVLEELFQDATKLGVTLICLVEQRSQEPSMTQARITLSNQGSISFEEIAPGGRREVNIVPDVADIDSCEQIARMLAPLTLSGRGAQQDLSQDVRLLDLLSIPSADAVETGRTWQRKTREELLRIPLGIRGDGQPLLLDLKEAAEKGMGPHGLVVGATGSGKSKLLQTIVAGLAIKHAPDEVNFVLVDFKGGASFADLASLPHVAGVITNLEGDLALIDRIYASIQGERARRQRILHEAGNLESIQQYQAKRQANPHMEPLPYLVLIVDEFAQLITNHPEFLDLFVSIGQVGRSLGLHMLLATQRIDEGRIQKLEGHLRYRICLRTNSAGESTSVIGTTDAYYLPSTPGLGYFKVDTDIYELFKAALISLPYVPAGQQLAPGELIREFTPTGKLIAHQLAQGKVPSTVEGTRDQHGNPSTEMDIVIRRLEQAQQQRKPADKVHQVWLPPLSNVLTLADILSRCGKTTFDGSIWPVSPPFGPLCIPVGLLDKPLEQTQEPLFLDFSGAGGHLSIVGAPRSGKSTLLRTIMASFIVTHTPRDVQFYCVDLGGALHAFEKAPHVGAVCNKSEREKIYRLINQMRKIIQERDFLFREQGIDSMVTYRIRRQAGELADIPFGDVFLVIDNLAQLKHDFEPLYADLTEIAATGLAFGVHILLVTNRWADVQPKLRENIGGQLELHLNDPALSEFGKAAAAALPSTVPGRGLTRDRLQFQAALPLLNASGSAHPASQQPVESLAQRAKNAWTQEAAPPILMLPSHVNWKDLPAPDGIQSKGVPIGLEEFRLEPVYIDLISSGPHFLIFGDMEAGKTTLLRTWMHGLESYYTPEQVRFSIIDYRKTLLDFTESKHLFAYACTPQMLKESVERLKSQLESRLQASSPSSLQQLRNPNKWGGTQHFLFVDDYETVVGPTGNPLSPLLDMLLHGRDVGFHFILARRVGGTTRTAFEAVFQRLKEMGSSGIILSGDPQEGVLLGTQRASLLPQGRGYLVRRNHSPTLIQVAETSDRGLEVV